MGSEMIEWPFIGAKNIIKLVDFYIRNLGFELYKKEMDFDGYRLAKLRLFDFYMVILKTDKVGPIYRHSEKVRKPRKKNFEPQEPPILCIPVPNPSMYFNTLKDKNVKILCEKKMLDYDLEGFYILDPEDNKILFFRDYHGRYDPSLWEWTWEEFL